jgi:hypothetical protein
MSLYDIKQMIECHKMFWGSIGWKFDIKCDLN